MQDLTYSTPDTNGNFGADPRFVGGTTASLNLQAGSPCRNRGTNSVLTSAPFISMSGKQVDSNLNRRLSGSTVDLGAYEYQSVMDVTSQFQIITMKTTLGSNGSISVTLFIGNNALPFLSGPETLVVNGLTGYTLTNKTG